MSDKRQHILKLARDRFRRFGIKKTSMRDIAKDAGLAVGTLYLHFKNKDAIVLAFVDEFRERHYQAAKEILASERSPRDKLRAYLCQRFQESRATRQGTPFAEEVTAAVLRCCPDRLAEEARIMIDAVRAILLEGVERGLFRIDDLEGDLEVFLYSIAWFFPTALTPVAMEPEEEAFLRVINWFIGQWSI